MGAYEKWVGPFSLRSSGCLRQHGFDLRSVIGARLGQCLCRHFSCIGIDAQMQSSPGASFSPAGVLIVRNRSQCFS
jgi:hypothetical protein